jgi:hypothetical protein
MKTTLVLLSVLFGFKGIYQTSSSPIEAEKWYYECGAFTEFKDIDSLSFCSIKDENATDWCYWNMKNSGKIGIGNYNSFDGVFTTREERWTINKDTLLIGILTFKIQILTDSTFVVRKVK